MPRALGHPGEQLNPTSSDGRMRLHDRRPVLPLRRRLAGPWQLDGERGALPRLTLERDVSPEGLRALAGDPQPEPQPPVVPRIHRALQPLEDPLVIFRGDADALIPHL